MLLALFGSGGIAKAESLRIATFNTELSRKGPGLLLRDIRKGDPQAEAVAKVIARIVPDVLLLNDIDYDHGGLTLGALAGLIRANGHDMPHHYAARPNSGWMTDQDLDGDGRRGGAGDAQGWGRYSGAGGMAILSRHPIGKARDLSGLIWAEQDWATLPMEKGKPFPSPQALKVQRLSSVGHWIVPVEVNGRVLTLLAFHATPPVFDGPEDRNGKRNHDEIMLWRQVLDGKWGGCRTAPLPFSAMPILTRRTVRGSSWRYADCWQVSG
ncbi:endonuclease/exonuclease/phosphatase family protein [Phycobium rhodophyticola]